MEQLTLKPRKAVLEETIENWDDNDDLDIGGEKCVRSNYRSITSQRLRLITLV
jgi:hypothetical protein